MITPTQRRNLETLARGLEDLPRHKRKKHFIMTYYFDIDKDYAPDIDGPTDAVKAVEKYPCNTSACAVGWGPVFGIKGRKNEDWVNYSTRVFGTSDDNIALFRWLFDGSWDQIDNTARGAAARIRYYFANGLPFNGMCDFNFRNISEKEYKALIKPYKIKPLEKREKS